MSNKFFYIIVFSLLMVACNNNNNASTGVQATTMQDVSNQMGFQPDPSRWNEFKYDPDNPPPGDWEAPSETIEQPPITTPPPTTPPPTQPPPATITQNPPTTTPPPTTPPPTTPPPATTTPTQNMDPVPGEFTAQLISSRERARVETIRNTLNSAGYQTEIQEAEVNGAIWYRLRLSGSFSREYAEHVAQRIQRDFREINDYWITRR